MRQHIHIYVKAIHISYSSMFRIAEWPCWPLLSATKLKVHELFTILIMYFHIEMYLTTVKHNASIICFQHKK